MLNSSLLKICQKHGASKGMFDDIATEKDPNVFKVNNNAQRWNRKKALQFVKDAFGMNGLEPDMHTVKLHDGREVTVPVVDFKEAMCSILNDPGVMKHIMKGLGPQTWRPTVNQDEHESDPNAMINDKDSGYLFQQGIDLHCPTPDQCDPKLVRPFPILIHIDKSHSDLFGNLAVAPIQVMP